MNLAALYIIPTILLVIALGAIAFMLHHQRWLVAELKEVEGILAKIRRGDRDSRLVRTIREHIVPVRTMSDDLIVLSRPLAAIRRDFAEDEISHHWAFGVGSLLTGIALLCTFVLIAVVMTSDVSGAISESTKSDDAASAHLSDAVKALGGKFFISAAGVGGSVAALFVAARARARIYRAADHPEIALAAAFTSLDTAELDLRRQDITARERQHAEVIAQLATLNSRIDRLQSIEVSVKDMGAEVSANLKHIMKDAMGEQLAQMLRTTMADVAAMAESVQASMTRAFGEQLKALATELQQALASVQKAVEGQGQGHLEQILDKLQNTVSGGFQQESARMATALQSFANVVPVIEQQLRAMTATAASESRQHAEESARISAGVLERMTSLVDAMASQQAAGAQAIDKVLAAADQSAETLTRRLAVGSSAVVSDVLSASRSELEGIASNLRQAAEASAARHATFDERAAEAARAINEASAELTRSAGTLRSERQHVESALTRMVAGGEAIQAAATRFGQASASLGGQIDNVLALSKQMQERGRELQTVAGTQQQHTRDMERVWPELFKTYLAQFKGASEELARSWDALYRKVQEMTNNVGSQFADSTEQLGAAVEQLASTLGRDPGVTASAKATPPPVPPTRRGI